MDLSLILLIINQFHLFVNTKEFYYHIIFIFRKDLERFRIEQNCFLKYDSRSDQTIFSKISRSLYNIINYLAFDNARIALAHNPDIGKICTSRSGQVSEVHMIYTDRFINF
jgi:hypothetical protein